MANRRGLLLRTLMPSDADETSPEVEREPRERSSYRWRYTAIGILLAIGAPAGALLLRILFGSWSWTEELAQNAFFYLYTLIGTTIVFAVAGFVAGSVTDALAWERDRFHELAEHDELTGLLNSRAFWERYRRAVDKACRYREPLSLLIIDVDHLKNLNDEEGHRFGNHALQHVARSVTRAKRADDVAARWGGDEFVILMAGASVDSSVRVAESLLQLLQREPVRSHRKDRTVVVTIGIASTGEDCNAQGLFDRADAAMYEGKRRGGNQYQVAPVASGPSSSVPISSSTQSS